MLDPAKWKYGPAYDPPPNAKIWNPVMIKMMKGENSPEAPYQYRQSANLLRHGKCRLRLHLDGDAAFRARLGKRSAACGRHVLTPKPSPDVRVAYTDEREIQHAMDLGALVVGDSTVRSVEEGKAARDWTMFPPLGKAQQGGGQAFDPRYVGQRPRRISQHHQRQRRIDRDD